MKRLIALIVLLVIILTIAVIPSKKENHYHTVVFYTYRNDPNQIETIRINTKSKINKPLDPSRPSANFLGWYDNRAGEGEEFDFTQTIKKSITLYALWDIYEYEIIYELNGGSWPSEEIMLEYPTVVNANNPNVFFPSSATRKAPIAAEAVFGRFSGWYIISQDDYIELDEEARKEYKAISKIESKKDLEGLFDEERRLVLYAHFRYYEREMEKRKEQEPTPTVTPTSTPIPGASPS